jgi:hypothetical protein
VGSRLLSLLLPSRCYRYNSRARYRAIIGMDRLPRSAAVATVEWGAPCWRAERLATAAREANGSILPAPYLRRYNDWRRFLCNGCTLPLPPRLGIRGEARSAPALTAHARALPAPRAEILFCYFHHSLTSQRPSGLSADPFFQLRGGGASLCIGVLFCAPSTPHLLVFPAPPTHRQNLVAVLVAVANGTSSLFVAFHRSRLTKEKPA